LFFQTDSRSSPYQAAIGFNCLICHRGFLRTRLLQRAIEVIKDEPWLKETFIPIVQQRGAAIRL
jgi:hypothetical protein